MGGRGRSKKDENNIIIPIEDLLVTKNHSWPSRTFLLFIAHYLLEKRRESNARKTRRFNEFNNHRSSRFRFTVHAELSRLVNIDISIRARYLAFLTDPAIRREMSKMNLSLSGVKERLH